MERINWAAILLAAALSVFAQSPTAGPGTTAMLEGSVTNAITGEPLLRAHVSMRGNTIAGKQVQYGALTDTSGKFSITGLPPGTYFAQVDRTGFVNGSAGWPVAGITLAAGDQKSGLKLQLVPFGSISGRVVSPNGEPVEFVLVTAEGPDGPVGNSTGTDEHGSFRLGGLHPGRYRILAGVQSRLLPPETRTDGTTETNYIPTYYPAAVSPQSAGRVTVQPGSDVAGIEIRLQQGPVVQVSGTVRDIPHGARPTVNFTKGRSISVEPQVKADGSFTIWRLPPGTYNATASAFVPGRGLVRSAPAEIENGSSNIEHVDLRLIPPADLVGRVEYDGDEIQPAKRQLVVEDIDHRASVPLAEIGDDGTFKLENIPAGRYRIRAAPAPAYVKSVRVGQTTTSGNILDLRNGAAGASVSVVLSAATGKVGGSVTGEGPAGGVRVLLVPEDPQAGLFSSATATAPSGAYAFQAIRPGRYKLIALDPADWRTLDDLEDQVEHIEVVAHDQLIQELTVPPQFQVGVRR